MLLRKISKVLGGFFFTLFLAIVISLFLFVQFTEYNNLKPLVTDLIKKQVYDRIEMSEEDMNQTYYLILGQCSSRYTELPMEFLGVERITIDCEELRTIEPEEISNFLTNAFVDSFFDSIYYKDYDCEILDCIKKGNMLAILSYKANEFLKNLLYIFLVFLLVSGIVLALSSSGWGILKSFGISFIFVGTTYFFLIFGSFFLPAMIEIDTVSKIFDYMAFYFLVVLITGILLTVIGYAGPRLVNRKKKNKERKEA